MLWKKAPRVEPAESARSRILRCARWSSGVGGSKALRVESLCAFLRRGSGGVDDMVVGTVGAFCLSVCWLPRTGCQLSAVATDEIGVHNPLLPICEQFAADGGGIQNTGRRHSLGAVRAFFP